MSHPSEALRSTQWPIDTSDFLAPERSVLRIFTFLLVFLLFCDWLAVPTPSGGIQLGAILPVTTLAIGYLFYRGHAVLDRSGLLLYLLFASLAIISNVLVVSDGGQIRFKSMLVVLWIYSLFAFRVPVSNRLFLVFMDRFTFLMLLPIPIIFMQWLLQFAIHPGLWLSILSIVPKPFLLVFNYDHAIVWGSKWVQPNGAVFLEVSILSQCLTLAFLVEFSIFQRPWRLLALLVALLSTLAASGPFMLGLCAPLILRKFPRKLIPYGVVAGLVLLAVLTFTDVFAVPMSRTGEAGNEGSSAYARITLPLQVIGEYGFQNTNIFKGLGSGTGDSLGAFLAVSKLMTEYGFACTLSFMAMFIYAIARSGQSLLVIWAFFIFFHVMGGSLAVPGASIAVLLLCGFLNRSSLPARAGRVPRQALVRQAPAWLPAGIDAAQPLAERRAFVARQGWVTTQGPSS